MTVDLKALLRRWDELKQLRMQREGEWQQIADYFLPQKDFNVASVKGAAIPRKVMTSVPQRCLGEYAQMVFGFMVDQVGPFVNPNAEQGLVQAGRPTTIDGEGREYLDTLAWANRDRMMRPKSGFLQSTSRLGMEYGAFGHAVTWTGHRRGFGARYMTRPARACWLDVDDDDIVNTLFYEFELTCEEVFRRWPDMAKGCDDLMKMWSEPDDKGKGKKVKILHCVYPRMGGERGSLATRKPFAEVFFAHEKKDGLLHEGGYDSFPYAVPRQRVNEGNPYGQGAAWTALPAAIALNRMQDLVEYAIGVKVAPPLFTPSRLFKQPRRDLGYFNYYDTKMLGFASLKDLVQPMPSGGDPAIGVEWMQQLQAWVEEPFRLFISQLRDAGNVTAEEVRYRKRMNMVGQTGLLTSLGPDYIGILAERTMEIDLKEGVIPPPPESLSGVGIEWEFSGPLHVAQKENQLDAIERLLALAQQALAVDPDAVAVLAVEEALRAAADGMSAPPTVTRSHAQYEAIIKERAQARQDAQDAQMAEMGARAARDASQAMQTQPTGAGGGMGMAA